MGDDTACSINELPKVTSILTSESVSKTEAFDMMVRFLSKHQFQYPCNGNNPQQQQQQQQVGQIHQDIIEPPRFGRVYHFWEDLYHVAETTAVGKGESLLHPQQQETLRKLRLVATPLNTEVIHASVNIVKNEEIRDEDDNNTAIKTKNIQNTLDEVIKVETLIKQEEREEEEKHRKSAKKNKKEKKKDKKRKRESTES